MAATSADAEFPCSLTLHIPFPTHRLASAAMRTLSVDQELSPLVTRSFSVVKIASDSVDATQQSPSETSLSAGAAPIVPFQDAKDGASGFIESETGNVLRTEYRASTNRMLRVSVNGFFESLKTIMQVMGELDVDVIHEKGFSDLEGVQGVEQGLTGTTATGA